MLMTDISDVTVPAAQMLARAWLTDPPRLHLIKPREHQVDERRLFCGNRADTVARCTSSVTEFEREPARSRCRECDQYSKRGCDGEGCTKK